MTSDFFSNLRTLSFSVDLARSIGLEAAVLLGYLLQSVDARSSAWHDISVEQLHDALPFWDERDLRRVWRQLVDQGMVISSADAGAESCRFKFSADRSRSEGPPESGPVDERERSGATPIPLNWHPQAALLEALERNHDIPREYALGLRDEFVLYWHERGDRLPSWSSMFLKHALGQWRRREAGGSVKAIDYGWKPDANAVEDLCQRQGMDADFIADLLPEFISYWKEKDSKSGTWNSKFILYARKQWGRHQRLRNSGGEPKVLSHDWKPSADVWSIFEIADIDFNFARGLLPQFRLYWRERDEPRASWGSVFVAYVRSQWAKQENLARSAESDFVQRHTDTDWRQDAGQR